MSLLFMDSCCWQPGSRWTSNTASQFTSTSFPSGFCYSSGAVTLDFTATAEVFYAFRAIWPGTSVNISATLFGDAGATTHVVIRRNASRVIEVLRGGTVIATGTTVIPDNAATHIQARVVISDTVGVVQVRLNGSTSNEINFSGDTKNAGTNISVDRWTVSTTGSSYNISDFILFNTSGSALNSWPGEVTVRPLVPTGNGATSQGVGSDGNSVNNYQLVDETPNNTSDYVDFATNGDGDTYAMADLPTGSTTVYAAQVLVSAVKTDAGAKSAKVRVRSGGTTYTGSARTLSTSAQTFTEIYETDPATSAAWTPTAVNAVEAGCEAAA